MIINQGSDVNDYFTDVEFFFYDLLDVFNSFNFFVHLSSSFTKTAADVGQEGEMPNKHFNLLTISDWLFSTFCQLEF